MAAGISAYSEGTSELSGLSRRQRCSRIADNVQYFRFQKRSKLSHIAMSGFIMTTRRRAYNGGASAYL